MAAYSQSKRAALIAALLTLPVFVLEMGSHLVPALHQWTVKVLGIGVNQTIQAVLTTLVLAGPGRSFFTAGLAALPTPRTEHERAGRPEGGQRMGLLDGGVAGAPSILPESARHVYFEAAAIIVTLILVGRMLEARARGRTGVAVTRLVNLQPPGPGRSPPRAIAMSRWTRWPSATMYACVPAIKSRWTAR